MQRISLFLDNCGQFYFTINSNFCYHENMIRDFYTIKEFAQALGMSEKTVRRMINNNKLNAFRIGSTSRGHYRIPGTEITRIASNNFKNKE